MSLFGKARWSRREVLKQSGIFSAAAAMAPLSASASSIINSTAGEKPVVDSGIRNAPRSCRM
jgi:hypothetical protein